MHSYLRAIGFSKVTKQLELDRLTEYIIKNAEKREMFHREDGTLMVEYTMTCSSDDSMMTCGIKVRGEEDIDGHFHYNHMFPYCKPLFMNQEEQVYINKKVDTEAYTGMCDDVRIGISLIFYIQNLVDYFHLHKGESVINDCLVKFAGLSTSGIIILPTKEHMESNLLLPIMNPERAKRIEEAKNGNPEAIQSMALEDIDKYAMIGERIKKEDVFSIVDTSIVPYGSESDLYTVTGNIIACEKQTNKITNEVIHMLSVEANGIVIIVSINDSDLIGEPELGRRFRGKIWLQGEI